MSRARRRRSGLTEIARMQRPGWLTDSYLWAAVLADLHRQKGDDAAAEHHRETALALAPTAAVRALLVRRLR